MKKLVLLLSLGALVPAAQASQQVIYHGLKNGEQVNLTLSSKNLFGVLNLQYISKINIKTRNCSYTSSELAFLDNASINWATFQWDISNAGDVNGLIAPSFKTYANSSVSWPSIKTADGCHIQGQHAVGLHANYQ